MNDISEIKGVGPNTQDKLEKNGLSTVMAIAVTSPAEIASMCGISENKARAIIGEARESLSLGFEKAEDFVKAKGEIPRLTTGCDNFDNMLGGGVKAGGITEIYGQYGSGKSQISHLLVARALMESPEAKVIFLDSEGTFVESRIKDFCEANDVDYEDAMKRIFVARAHNIDHQILLIDEVETMMQKDPNYKLLVVDSLTTHFRSEMIGRGQLASRQQMLNKHMHKIMKIADLFKIPVFVTNQVQSNPAAMFGDPIKPVGGNIVGHACLVCDSLVVTEEGFKHIQDVQVGEKIYNGKKFVKVLEKSTPFIKPTLSIRSNNIIESSYEHLFPIDNGGKRMDTKAEDLDIGDLLEAPKKINVKEQEIKINHRVDPLAKLSIKMGKSVKSWLLGNFKGNKELQKATGITIRQLRRVINQQYPTKLSVLRRLVKYASGLEHPIDNWFIYVNTPKHRSIKLPSVITKELVRLYGAWICDGDKSSNNSVRIRKHSSDYLEYLGRMSKKAFGINYRVFKIPFKDCYQLDINSVDLIKVFRELDIDKFIFLKKEILMEFIASLFDGDGCIHKSRLSFSQMDKYLVTKLQMWMQVFGIQSSIRQDRSGGFGGDKLITNLNVLSHNKGMIAQKMKNINKLRNFDVSTGKKKQQMYHGIKEIKELGFQKVLDIGVEGEYFLCNGIITHNSQYRIYIRPGKAGSRHGKLVDSPDLPNNECNFMITQDGIVDV